MHQHQDKEKGCRQTDGKKARQRRQPYRDEDIHDNAYYEQTIDKHFLQGREHPPPEGAIEIGQLTKNDQGIHKIAVGRGKERFAGL